MVSTQLNWHELFDSDPPRRRFAVDSDAAIAGECITVASQKGGVGKTTTAVNLAAALGLCGRKTLLLDFDPQANATSGVSQDRLELERGSGRFGFHRALESRSGLFALIRETQFENLWVLPASNELSSLPMIQSLSEEFYDLWQIRSSELKSAFDCVLVDCPPSLGGLPRLALAVSSSVIIPVQCEYYAMEGLSQILPVIEELRERANPALEIGGLLLTMYSSRVELARDVEREVREHFPSQVFSSVIPRDIVLPESSSHGLPVMYYDFQSRGAWSYLNLGREIVHAESERSPDGGSSSAETSANSEADTGAAAAAPPTRESDHAAASAAGEPGDPSRRVRESIDR